MALENVSPILAKEFVFAKLDFDRDTGAHDVELRYIDKLQGLPWFVFLDGDGKALIDSNGPAGNVGFPAKAEEYAHFSTMLEKVQRRLTDADIALLLKTMEDANK
jgi:hypothetical protein